MKTLLINSICILLLSCSQDVYNYNKIPNGAIWLNETIRRDTAIHGYNALAIWAQTATLEPDQPETTPAKIEIDYWKVIEIFEGDSTEIFFDGYNYDYLKMFTTNEAGLYCRKPNWFAESCNDIHTQAENMYAQNGLLTIDINKTPNVILHWWTPKLTYKRGAVYCVQANIQITGNTAIQFGMDYWRELDSGFNVYDPTCIKSNNCEAWISDWIYDTDEGFYVVTVPVRNLK